LKSTRLYMAPMKGFTDFIFRNTYAEHFEGVDLAIAPFIASKRDAVIKPGYVRDLIPENNTRLPVIPQILSKSAKDFIRLADCFSDMGYDVINWNLGCPFPTVTRKKRGSGLLPHTDRIRRFLDTAIPGIRGSISIKLRLGWEQTEEIFRLIPILNQYPLEEVIIHPRTGIQRYGGTIDLESFARCADRIRHPVVYNGDIQSVADFNRLSQRFVRINRWMLGRWCIADPFLASTIKGGGCAPIDRISRLRLFHESLFAAYRSALDGPSHLLNRMKGFWRYISLPFRDCRKSMKLIFKSTHPDQYLFRVNRFFDTNANSPDRVRDA